MSTEKQKFYCNPDLRNWQYVDYQDKNPAGKIIPCRIFPVCCESLEQYAYIRYSLAAKRLNRQGTVFVDQENQNLFFCACFCIDIDQNMVSGLR